MQTVCIFRHQLFKYSETFITGQAERLTAFDPLYTGRERFGEGPANSRSIALADRKRNRNLVRRIHQVATRSPGPYLELLSGYAPALIHAHFGVEGVYALPLAKRLGVPLVTTFHGFDATLSTKALLTSGSPSWVNYVRHRRALAAHGDLFICVSEFVRERVLALGFPPDRTVVHHIGIDTRAIQPGTEDDDPIILHVARLVEKKGTEYLIRAFAERRNAEAGRLVIIGDGPKMRELVSLSEALGIRARVEFRGACSNEAVVHAMRSASMLVQPSVTASNGDTEGLGTVLIEACAAGLPAITTDNGGMAEGLRHAKTGYCVPERDSQALADAMADLLSDSARRREFGAAARDMCEQHFDVRRQTRVLEDHYRAVLS